MNCATFKDNLLDHAQAPELEAGAAAHARGCPACAQELAGMRETMAFMDAWQAPEPSPYFDQRLLARVREIKAEEASRAHTGWFAWMRRPVWAACALAVAVGGLAVYEIERQPSETLATNTPGITETARVTGATGSQQGSTAAVQRDTEELVAEVHDGSRTPTDDLEILALAEFEVLDDFEPANARN